MELPELGKLAAEGWRVISINVDEKFGALPYIMDNKRIHSLPVVLAGKFWWRSLKDKGFDSDGVPKTVIVRDGKVIAEAYGGFDAANIISWHLIMHEGMERYGVERFQPQQP